MIKIITNTLGSGDWIKIIGLSDIIWEGHRPNVSDLQFILDTVSRSGCELIEIDDEQMEEGTY